MELLLILKIIIGLGILVGVYAILRNLGFEGLHKHPLVFLNQ